MRTHIIPAWPYTFLLSRPRVNPTAVRKQAIIAWQVTEPDSKHEKMAGGQTVGTPLTLLPSGQARLWEYRDDIETEVVIMQPGDTFQWGDFVIP